MYITVCRLQLHDYLFYASREMGRLYETEKYLHNYGLTYALGLVKTPYANVVQVPRYAEELNTVSEQGVYITPAYPLHATFAFHTFKMATEPFYSRTEQTSQNLIVYGRAKELAPESAFEFFVLSERAVALPRWIRLGKWMAKARVEVVKQGIAQARQGAFRADGALNPLDLSQMPENCNIVAMAPASLITNASCSGDYYELASGENGKGKGRQDDAVRLPAGMNYRPGRR